MVTIDKYVRATSLEEAYELNQAKNSRIIGGMLWIRTGKGKIRTAIDLSDLELDKIEEDESQFSIGAMTTLRSIELNESLNTYTNNAVKDAVKDIVGVQFRNMATLGGSIWGRFGFSDVLTVFLLFDTYVELYKGGIIPLEQFVTMDKDNDILVRIIVKKSPMKSVYSAMRAQRTDLPVLTCGASVVNGEYKATVGARPDKAVVIKDEEGILASGLTEESINLFSEYVASKVNTQTNLRGSAEYRKHLTKVLLSRNLKKMGDIK